MAGRFRTPGGAALICLFASMAASNGCGAQTPSKEPPEKLQAEAPPKTPPAPASVAGAFPNTDDGLPVTQLGLYEIAYWDYEDKFLNLLRNDGGDFTAIKRWHENETVSFTALYRAGMIDPETLVPTRIPDGLDYMRTVLFRNGAKAYPAYYAGTYVFDWEGEAQARCGFGVRTRVVSAHRIECDYDAASADWSNIEIFRIGPGFKNPRLYRKENEARLNAGEIFDPKFLQFIGRYKIIRTMDMQDANMSWTRSVDELATKKALGWAGHERFYRDRLGQPRGVPIEGLFDMAVASDTALWMNVPGIIGAPEVFVDEAEALQDYYPVEKGRDRVRALARDHAREILSSPEWRKYADEIVRSLIASGYPETRTLYVELWNEVWNTANPWWRMSYYAQGLADGLFAEGGWNRAAYGYFSAMFAERLSEALKAKGRSQPFVIVLAGQNANPDTTRYALIGFKRYFEERGIDPAPYLKRAGVSTASYYGGALDDFVTLEKIKADPVGLMTAATDFIVKGPASQQGSLAWVVSKRAEHEAIARQYGAFFLGDYEGESHEAGGGALRKDPLFINWVETWIAGPEGERLTRAWAEALLKQNPEAVIANYHSLGLFDPEGDAPTDASLAAPWIDGFWTDETGRQKALGDYLRGSPYTNSAQQ